MKKKERKQRNLGRNAKRKIQKERKVKRNRGKNTKLQKERDIELKKLVFFFIHFSL